jgi:processive rubber oxygenase RoxA-like protein
MIENKKKILIHFLFIAFLVNVSVYAENSPVIQDPDALNLDKIIYLEQNWTDEDREYFYFTDQGSRLVPYDFFLNLELAGSNQYLSSPENMLRYGFLPIRPSKNNPDGLPIGLTRNKDFMGPTCAACHTQQIKYNNQFVRIDGGQAFIDLPMFLDEIVQSMENTLTDENKFNRFTTKIYGKNVIQDKRDDLKQRLQEQYDIRKDYNRRNHSNVAYGYSRLDAFGAILNKGLHATGVKDNFSTPNAPTSYPYLWDAPQHDYVEWDGAQSNSSLGALARNVGEVIGVFGDVTPETKKWLGFIDGGYSSSIQADNLRGLEKVVVKLHSPLWPESFPTIDNDLAKRGRTLYEKHCLSCHLDIDRTDPDRKIHVRMSSLEVIQTDPLMASNAVSLIGKTGIFEGRKRFYTVGGVLGKEAPALYIVNNIMGGVLKNNFLQALLAKRDAKALGHPDEIHPPKYLDGKIIKKGEEVIEKNLLAYKARPLNGIWSAAPHLHNGSVPNLYQLLLPAEKRDKTFYIGTWDFDPVNVGYVSTKTPGSFLFDTTLKGNSNAGHEYGTGKYGKEPFTEDEIWALVEYMKTL